MAQIVMYNECPIDFKEGPFVACSGLWRLRIEVEHNGRSVIPDSSIAEAIKIEFPRYYQDHTDQDTLKVVDWLNEMVRQGIIVKTKRPWGTVWVCPATE